MEPARPLRSVFTDLAASPTGVQLPGDEVLDAHGHPDLPASLVAEAVVSYADTAPYEVAEHLAPFVRANSPVPLGTGETAGAEPDWLGLLTTAPRVDPVAVLDALDDPPPAGPAAEPGGALDLDFGHGVTSMDVATSDDVDEFAQPVPPYGYDDPADADPAGARPELEDPGVRLQPPQEGPADDLGDLDQL